MNVLHLTHTNINVDSRILKEMRSLADLNDTFNVSGIGVMRSGDSSGSNSEFNFSIYSLVLKSRNLVFLPLALRRIITLIEFAIKMVFMAVSLKPKIIHCHDDLVLPVGVIVKLFTGAKLIYDAHELESDKNSLSKIFGKITLFVEKSLWRTVDALIVVSPSIKSWYMYNVGEKDTEIILNSPVYKRNTALSDKSYLRNKYSIPEESKIFLYIGILGCGRGIELITDVFKKSDLKSSVIFLGYGEFSEELSKMAEHYNNIYVHSSVPHEQVVPIAKSADVGLCLIQNVSLSDYYCLPNKLFEYCFAEIPVLASNFPDIAKTVTKYNLGLCCELNVESVYNAVKAYEEMKELPEIDADNLYDLSWSAQEENLTRLYNRLVSH